MSSIQVKVDFDSDDLQLAAETTNQYIQQGATGSIYISIAKNPEAENPIILQKFSCALNFKATIKDSDGNIVQEYDDDYALDVKL